MEEDSERTSVERRDPSLFSRRFSSEREMGGRLGRDSTHSLPLVPITGMLLEMEEEEEEEGYEAVVGHLVINGEEWTEKP